MADAVEPRRGFELSRDDLLDLIEWMGLRYGGNTPVFATENPYGQPLPGAIRLKAAWLAIFGPGKEQPGVWRQCPTCRGMYVAAPGSDRRLNGDDIARIVERLAQP